MLKMKSFLIFILICVSSNAMAQTQPDAPFLQKVINAIAKQRDVALNNQAGAEAQVADLSEQIARLKARISELEKKQGENK
jgi:TolA-binding protein